MLANLGCDLSSTVVPYEHPPLELSQMLLSDVLGVSTYRVISV